MTDKIFWFTLNINPEPWAVGPIGYNAKVKKPYMGQNQQLNAYKQAVKEEMKRKYPDFIPLDGYLKLNFYFWRQLATYENKATSRKTTKHIVDTTNMQKALEDSLQGIVYANDNKIREVHSVTVEQSMTVDPKIVISIQYWESFDFNIIPQDIWAAINNVEELEMTTDLYERW